MSASLEKVVRAAVERKAREIAKRAQKGKDLTAEEWRVLRDVIGKDSKGVDAPATDRKGRESAQLLKKYARSRGCDIRTAQRHRAAKKPEYLEFVRVQTGEQVSLFEKVEVEGGDDLDMMVEAMKSAYNKALESGDVEMVTLTSKQLKDAIEQRRKVRLSDPDIKLREGSALARSAVVLCLARAHQAMSDATLEALVEFGKEIAADPDPAKVRDRALERRDKLFRILGDKDALIREMLEEK